MKIIIYFKGYNVVNENKDIVQVSTLKLESCI